MAAEKKVKESVLDFWTLLKQWYIGTFYIGSAHTYQRMYGVCFAASLIPIIKKLYPGDKKEMADMLLAYGDKFYITEPTTGMVINGIVTRMEEQRAEGAPLQREDMEALKSGLMGALAGFGDTIFTGTLRPIAIAIFTPMAISGNIMGPLGFQLFKTAARIANSIFWYTRGLKLGTDALGDILEEGNVVVRRIMSAIGVLSMFVMGAMTAKYVSPSFNLAWTSADGAVTRTLQDFLNGLFPGILSIGSVLLVYWLIGYKKVKSLTIILLFAVFCILGAYIGLF